MTEAPIVGESRTVGATAPAASSAFRDPTRLARWVEGLLWCFVGIAGLTIVSDIWREWFFQSVLAGTWRSRGAMMDTAQLIDGTRRTIAIAHVILYFCAAILFLRWVYRCNANAGAMGTEKMEFTPGWAVGCYFVPFVNLFLPYQAMKEIWTRSLGPTDRPAPQIVRWWWALFLLINVADWVFGMLAYGTKTIDAVMLSGRVSMVVQALTIVGAIVATRLVRRISVNQVKRRNVSEVFA